MTTVRFCNDEYSLDTEVIDCINEEVDDLGPLAELRALRELRLEVANPHEFFGHTVKNMYPLEGLSQLEVVELSGCPISDLGPLASLANLRDLDLRETHVTDLSPLSTLPRSPDSTLARRRSDLAGLAAARR